VPIRVRALSACVVIELSLHDMAMLRDTDSHAALVVAGMMADCPYVPGLVDTGGGLSGGPSVAKAAHGENRNRSGREELFGSLEANGAPKTTVAHGVGSNKHKAGMNWTAHGRGKVSDEFRGTSGVDDFVGSVRAKLSDDHLPVSPVASLIASRKKQSGDDHSTHSRQRPGEGQDKVLLRMRWEAAKDFKGDEHQLAQLVSGDATAVRALMNTPTESKTISSAYKTDEKKEGSGRGANSRTAEVVISIPALIDSCSNNSAFPAMESENAHTALSDSTVIKKTISSEGTGPKERLSEVQRHDLKQALKMLQEAWVNISMGCSSMVLSQLHAIQPYLGEAGSQLFKQLFQVKGMPEVSARTHNSLCEVTHMHGEA
jgi:hypothetical protein